MNRRIAVRSNTPWPRTDLAISSTCLIQRSLSQCYLAACCHGRLENSVQAFGTSDLGDGWLPFRCRDRIEHPGLPFDWYAQFKLEERFGFNTTTMKTWVLDRLKGLLLAVLLGYPLLMLVLKLIEWTGPTGGFGQRSC